MPNKIIIPEQVLIKLINEKKTCSEILKILKISKSCLYRNLNEYKLSIPNYQNELKFDNKVFDKIDTEEKAYWLGFLYADGYVSNGKYNNSVELSLSAKDIDHLKKFKNFLKDKRKIKVSKVAKNFTRGRVLVTNKHFRNQLIKLGCLPNKSLILKFPSDNIFHNKDLIIHFIRGYVDGDGCLSNTKTGRLSIEIIGTKEFLEGIRKYFPEFKSIRKTRSSEKGLNNFKISCNSNKADTVAKRLYKDATIYLDRKFNKFANLCRDV